MKIRSEDGVIVIKLDTGIELELHGDKEYLSINTPERCWDVEMKAGQLILDGHVVQHVVQNTHVPPSNHNPNAGVVQVAPKGRWNQ